MTLPPRTPLTLPTVATVPTACGIETLLRNSSNRYNIIVATVLTACGIETLSKLFYNHEERGLLQQYLPLAVCDEGCEAAEERSDDESRTSLVPD